MAHSVQFSIPERNLGRSDVEFKVKQGETILGTLRISKGALVWFPKNTSRGHKIGWAKFHEIMKTMPRREWR